MTPRPATTTFDRLDQGARTRSLPAGRCSERRGFALAILLLAASGGSAIADDGDQTPRRLYVPAENLDVLVHRDHGGVLLPRDEFEQLLAGAASVVPADPQIAALASADYAARIDGDQLVLAITVRGRNFTSNWATLTVRVGALGIEAAHVDDEAALLTRGDPPELLHWLVKDQGESTLTLEASLPLAAVGSDRVAAFDLAGAPAGELRLTLPAGKHLQVGGVSLKRPAAADAEAEYVVAVGGHKSIELRITDRVGDSRADALTFASTAHGLYVAPGEVTWTARTSLQIIGRKIDQLVARVPRSVEITAVESAGLESWELADDPRDAASTTLKLRWRQPFDGTHTLTFRGVVAQRDGGEWTAPTLLLGDVTSHTGVVEVQYPPGIRVQPQVIAGARASTGDAANGESLALPAPANAAGGLRYSAFQEDFTLTFTTAPKARELHVAMTNMLDVTADGLVLFTLVEPSPLFDSLFELTVSLPAEWEVQELTVAGSAVAWRSAPAAAGINDVRIPLDPPLAPGESRPVRLVTRRQLENWPVEQTPVRFAIPEVKLPQASVVEALYGVTGDDDVTLTPIDVTGLDPARRADLATLAKQLAGSGRTLKLGFAYQDTVFSGQIETLRLLTRISAATLSFVQLDRETINTHLETQVRITGGGAKELQVSLPEAAGADLQFELMTVDALRALQAAVQQQMLPPPVQGPRIVEQQPASPANGRRVWTLKLDRRLYDDAVITTNVRQPRGAAQPYAPLVLDVVGAERQNGHIAVIAGDDQRVTLTATDAGGRPLPLVDPVDFPASFTFPVAALRSGRQRIVASVQYLQPGYSATVSDQRFDRSPVPTAVCRAATYETVIARTGELQHEATLELVAVGVQALSVQLPAGDELWAALVDGSPVEVRVANAAVTNAGAGSRVFTLPLPPVDPADKPRTVQLLYRGSANPLTAKGAIRQTPPQVSVVTGRGGVQPLEMLAQSWMLHHSPDTLLLAGNGRFHAADPLYAGSLLGRLGTLWTLPTSQEAVRMAVIAGLGLFLVALTAALCRRFRSVSILAVVLTLAAVGVLIAICLPAFQQVREAARKSAAQDRLHQLAVEAARSADEYSAAPPADAPTEPWGTPARRATAPDQAPVGAIALERARQLGLPEMTPPPAPPTAAPATPQDRRAGAIRDHYGSAQSLFEEKGLGAMPSIGQPVPALDAMDSWIQLHAGQAHENRGEVESIIPFDSVPQIAQQPLPGTPPAEPQAGAAAAKPARGRGALLSLALALVPPENFVSRKFDYAGAETDPAAVDLDVTYADRRGSQMLIAAVAGGVLLLMWLLRKASLGWRALVGVGVIAAPLGLTSLAPPVLLITLDGVLIGGVLGLMLWGVLALVKRCPCCQRTVDQPSAVSGPSSAVSQQSSEGGGQTPVTGGLAGWLVTAASLALAGSVAAQEPAPPADPEAGRPVVIIPYEAGSDPLAADRVLVPSEYFLKLWKAAHPEEQPAVKPPVPGVVAAALYRAELEPSAEGEAGKQRTVKVTARFVVRQLGTESARLTLPLGPAAIESALLDDTPAVISTSDDGAALTVVLTKTGAQVLDVVFRLPAVNVTDESGRFTLPLRPVASGRLSFVVPPGDATEIRLNGSMDTYRLREDAGTRVLEAPVAAGGDITVSWRPTAARGAGDGTVQVESTIGATVDDAGLTVRHRFRYVVSQGTLADVRFAVPAGVSIKRIAGADVAGWEQADAADGRILKVFLRRDVDDSTSLDFDLFQKLTLTDPPTAVAIPSLAPQAVTRETGDLAVFAEPQLAVESGTTVGLRQVNVANFTMDAALTQPGATARFAYRFDGRPFELPVSLSRRQPETRVVSEHGAQVRLRKLRIASRLVFDLREAPRASLSIALPADYLALDVQGDYLTDWSVNDVAAGRVLTVELDQPRTGRVQVLLEGTQPRDPSAAGLALTVPQPLHVNRQESRLGVWIDDAFTAAAGDAADWRPLDPAQLTETIHKLRGERPQFGFRSTQPAPGAVPLTLQRAVPQLSGDAVILAAVSDASLDYGLNLRWRIDRAAADTFVVATPDWMGDRVEFTGENIRQIQQTPRADGGRIWTITLHEPVREQYLLSAVVTQPLPADDAVRVPDVRLLRSDESPGEAQNLAVQRRFLVLSNLSGVHRLIEAAAAPVERALRDQLPLQLPGTLLDQAVEIAALPVGRPLPSWRLESSAANQEAAATVLLADLRTVLAHDGSWRTQADYKVRNRGRQFLAIVPPANARLLSVLVRERPSQAIRQDAGEQSLLLVPLPATSIVDLSFTVRLVFAGRLAGPLPKTFTPAGREVALPAPHVASNKTSPEFGMPVLQTLWRVDVPDDVLAQLVESGGRSNLTPGDDDAAEQAYGKSVLEDLRSQLSIKFFSESMRKSASQDHLHNITVAVEQARKLSDKQLAAAQEQQELLAKAERTLQELQSEAESAPPAVAGESLTRNDFGREFIVGNNGLICEFNCPKPAATDFDSEGLLNFREQVQLNESELRKDLAELPAVKSRAGVKQQLEDQSLSYFNAAQPQALGVPQGMGGLGGGSFGGGQATQDPASLFRFSPGNVRGVQSWYEQSQSEQAGLAQNDAAASLVSGASGAWRESGGLSIPMELPRSGRELTFTKVGGDPQLTLLVRPRETLSVGLGLLWAMLCLIAAAALVRRLTRGGLTGAAACRAAALAGLAAALLLPSPLRYVGLALFIAGAGCLLARRVARPDKD